jgi:hypothetical protein
MMILRGELTGKHVPRGDPFGDVSAVRTHHTVSHPARTRPPGERPRRLLVRGVRAGRDILRVHEVTFALETTNRHAGAGKHFVSGPPRAGGATGSVETYTTRRAGTAR